MEMNTPTYKWYITKETKGDGSIEYSAFLDDANPEDPVYPTFCNIGCGGFRTEKDARKYIKEQKEWEARQTTVKLEKIWVD